MVKSQSSALTSQPSTLAIVQPDDASWDAFALRHPHGSLLQSSGWAALKTSFGWQGRRFAVAGPQGIVAGAQVLFRSRFGISAAYVPRGPLWSGEDGADGLLLGALERHCRRAHAIFLRLEPNIVEDDPRADATHTALQLQGFRPADALQPRSSVHLDLAVPPDRLLAGMSKGHRADIRRSAREGVRVRAGESSADLDAFYAIMESTSRRARFGIHSRAYYVRAWELFAPDDTARLFLAEQNGQPVATALVFGWGGAGLYLYSGSTEQGLKGGAQHAIQWQAIQWARERGCRIYDFWGIPDELGRAATADEAGREQLEAAAKSHPLYGVYRFKKGFGGQVVRYLPAYDRVFVPALYALLRRRLGG